MMPRQCCLLNRFGRPHDARCLLVVNRAISFDLLVANASIPMERVMHACPTISAGSLYKGEFWS